MPPARTLGYRVLGRGFDYLLHLRPAAWPILTLHFLTGSALAIGVAGFADGARLASLLPGTLAFVIGLNGGTLALNSAFDRDRGNIAYLSRPPVPPRGLAWFGLGLMIAGQIVALSLPGAFALAYAACLVLSIVYSVPPIRLKGMAGLDWAVNFLGFGWLTPYAGWALTGRPLTESGAILLGSFATLFGALYPLTQLYQLEEDRARGDRTLAVSLGVTRIFALSVPMTGLALQGLGIAAGLAQWSGPPGARWAALLAAGAAWTAVLLPWWKRRNRLGPAGHERWMHRAFLAWMLTDLAVLWAFAR